MSGIALGLQAPRGALSSDPTALPELLNRTRVEAQRAVYGIRRVIDGLRPAALDRRGLVGAGRETATALGIGTPDLALRILALPLLAPPIEEAAFRILAEWLTNVARTPQPPGAPSVCSSTMARCGWTWSTTAPASHRMPPPATAWNPCAGAPPISGAGSSSSPFPHGTAVSALLPMGAP